MVESNGRVTAARPEPGQVVFATKVAAQMPRGEKFFPATVAFKHGKLGVFMLVGTWAPGQAPLDIDVLMESAGWVRKPKIVVPGPGESANILRRRPG